MLKAEVVCAINSTTIVVADVLVQFSGEDVADRVLVCDREARFLWSCAEDPDLVDEVPSNEIAFLRRDPINEVADQLFSSCQMIAILYRHVELMRESRDKISRVQKMLKFLLCSSSAFMWHLSGQPPNFADVIADLSMSPGSREVQLIPTIAQPKGKVIFIASVVDRLSKLLFADPSLFALMVCELREALPRCS